MNSFNQKSDSFFLAGILLLFLAAGSLYLWFIPPFEGPDEAQHFAYISWLINEGSLPPQGEEAWQNGVEQESGQPPFYYFIASLPARLVDINQPTAVYRPNPHFVAPLPRNVFDNDNRAIYNPDDLQPLQGGWLAFYLARVVTLLFGVLLVLGVYALVRQIWPQPREVALGAAFLVALTPQVLFIGSMVSNDVPAAALSTLALWLFARELQHGSNRSAWWGTAVGLILGLAGLTKVNAFTLALPLGLGLMWLWLSGRRSFGQVILFGLAFSAGLSLSAGWWLGRSWWLYGSPVGLDPHDQTPWAISAGAKLDPFLLRWKDVWRSYWLSLGWGTIRLAPWPGGWPYTVLFGALFLALAGWLRALWQWWHRPETRPSASTQLLLVLLGVGVLINVILLENWMHRVIAPYGRLLFPVIGGITLFLVLGWRQIHPRLPLLAYLFVAALGILTPFILIRPAYTHTKLNATEIAALPPSRGWRFGETAETPFAELLSFSTTQNSTNVGDVVQAQLCWRALATPSQDYAILLHIIGPANQLVSTRRSYPGEGRYPTSQWEVGAVWCENWHIGTNPYWPDNRIYQLDIGFINEETGERLIATDDTGSPLPNTFIGRVRLLQPLTEVILDNLPPPPDIHLVSHELATTWQVGTAVPLTLTWATIAPLSTDYQVFIHVRQPETAEPLLQADGPPQDGWYPSSWWPPYQPIPDTRYLTIPPDFPTGKYQVVVGLYDLAVGTRPIPEINLGEIEVVP